MTSDPDLPCLPLDSPRWLELEHAYGQAEDIPSLLRQLDTLPPSSGEDAPWFLLWSELAHQGDVYSASFAAVPHVVRVLARAPMQADAGYFQFPAWVEICRQRRGIELPPDLQAPYLAALAALPGLVAAASQGRWDDEFLSCALAAVAAAKGSVDVAEALLALSPATARAFLDWQDRR